MTLLIYFTKDLESLIYFAGFIFKTYFYPLEKMNLNILIAENNKEIGYAETMFISRIATPVTAVRQMAGNTVKEKNFISLSVHIIKERALVMLKSRRTSKR